MRKDVTNMIMIMIVVIFVGIFGYLAGTTAKMTVETGEVNPIVSEIDNVFWLMDDGLKGMND